MFSWSFIVFSTIFSVTGQLALKHAMIRLAEAPPDGRPLLLRIALSPRVIGGLAIYGFGVIFWLMAMSYLEVSFLYPFASLSYLGIILGSYLLFKEHVTRIRLAGIAVIVVGVVLIGLSAA